MKRLHYGAEIVTPFAASQDHSPQQKPEGLWYSCGDEWLHLLKAGWDSELERVRVISELAIDPQRIAFLNTPERVAEFDRIYGVTLTDAYGETERLVRWASVAQHFGGVEFCPFFYEIRWSFDWYRPLDVSSGCVWDPAAVRVVSATVYNGE